MVKHLIIMDEDTLEAVKSGLINIKYVLNTMDSCYATSEIRRYLDRIWEALEDKTEI